MPASIFRFQLPEWLSWEHHYAWTVMRPVRPYGGSIERIPEICECFLQS